MADLRLPSLDPVGLGGPDVESLSSYFLRSAESVRVLPGQLVFRMFTWTDRQRHSQVGQWCRRPGRVRVGKNINSYLHANVWLRLMQRYTQRADLEQLTTHRWDHLFPSRGFQRAHLTWCPLCLRSDSIPYHRLAWMLQVTRVCLHHKLYLQDRCGHCGRMIPVTHERAGVCRCPFCATDLRAANLNASIGNCFDFDQWAAGQIGQIIGMSATLNTEMQWAPVRVFGELARSLPSDRKSFARFVKVSKITAWYWLNGRARPTLWHSLHVFYRFGISLAAHLKGGGAVSEKQQPFQAQAAFLLRPVRHVRRIDWCAVLKHLEAALRQPAGVAPSLTQVGREIAIDKRSLRAHYPELCRRIGRRYIACNAAKRRARVAALGECIANTASTLVHAEFSPTPRNIALVMGRPGLFCRPEARIAFNKLRFAIPAGSERISDSGA